MKIYIVGSVASGKSTLARRLSQATGIPCHHLDEVVHEEDPAAVRGTRKRSVEERDRVFYAILSEPSYIIDDTGRKCFAEGMRRADEIVLLDIPQAVRNRRILLRWVKQNLGMEKCSYKPDFAMLRAMFRWARLYDTGEDGMKARVLLFGEKVTVLRSDKETAAYIQARKGGL